MTKRYFIYIILIILLLVFGFDKSNDDPFSKFKTLTQVIRLVQEGYFEDFNMNEALEGAIKGFLETLDPHSQYINSEELEDITEQFDGKFEGIGIEYSMLDGYITVISPIPETPSERAGLQSGDKIVKINNESAYKISTKDVFKKLRGKKGSEVSVHILRADEEPFEVILIRDQIPIKSVISNFIINDSIGYIKINRFANKTHNELMDALSNLESNGMKQLILDLRNNGGGLLNQAVKMVDTFVNSNDTIVYTKGNLRNANEVYYAHKSSYDKQYKLIVLINNGSASASEIVSGALQDLDRGTIIGERSFGKGLVQRQYELSDGSAARITIAQYFTPSGRLIQRSYDKGIGDYYSDKSIEDSSLIDTTIYFTKKGRTVYGGGGIWPDLNVEYSKPYIDYLKNDIRINSKRPIFKYASTIKDNIKNKYENEDVYFNYVSNYIISANNINNDFSIEKFSAWLVKQEIQYKEANISRDWDYIKIDIFAEIGSAIWGKNISYKIKSLHDEQILKAIEYLNND